MYVCCCYFTSFFSLHRFGLFSVIRYGSGWMGLSPHCGGGGGCGPFLIMSRAQQEQEQWICHATVGIRKCCAGAQSKREREK